MINALNMTDWSVCFLALSYDEKCVVMESSSEKLPYFPPEYNEFSIIKKSLLASYASFYIYYRSYYDLDDPPTVFIIALRNAIDAHCIAHPFSGCVGWDRDDRYLVVVTNAASDLLGKLEISVLVGLVPDMSLSVDVQVLITPKETLDLVTQYL